MGKVPALSHHGRVVTETPAILAYLADAFPEAGLAPPAPEGQAYYRWLFFAAGPLEAALVDRALGFEVPIEKRGMVGYGTYEDTLDGLSKAVLGEGYIAGEKFSAADIYVGAHIAWGTQFGTLPKRPEYERYKNFVTDRDAYRRANELDNALMPDTEE